MFRTINESNYTPSVRLFQIIIELIMLLETPERKNYWLTKENALMYDLFKSDRQTYLTIANAMSGGKEVDRYDLGDAIQQQYEIEFERLEADFKKQKEKEK